MKTPFGRQPAGLRLERMQSSRRYRAGPWWRKAGTVRSGPADRAPAPAEPDLDPHAPYAWQLA